MRVSREAKAESKARILGAAARMVRERGIEATAVAEVMEAAGMTNGGFYRHFRSKDDMIAQAIHAAFDDIGERFERRVAQQGAEAALDAYVDEYLSERHLEHPGHGCPIASLATDASRNGSVFAPEFAAGVERLIERFSNSSDAPERAAAIRQLTMLIGTVVVARAVGRGALRKEIIAACDAGLDRHPGKDEQG